MCLAEAAGRGLFDKDLHPRDFRGKFAKKLGGLKLGATATAPGGIKVKRLESGFQISGGAGLGHHKVDGGWQTGKPAATELLHSPNQAAALATVRSLRSRDPGSIGGDRHYEGIEDFDKHGKSGKPASGASAHLDQMVNYGGIPTKRGDVMKDLQRMGGSQQQIDRYMQGADLAAKATPKATPGKGNPKTVSDLKPGDRFVEPKSGQLLTFKGGPARKPDGSQEPAKATDVNGSLLYLGANQAVAPAPPKPAQAKTKVASAAIPGLKTASWSELGDLIAKHWSKPDVAAKPYIEALQGASPDGMYGVERSRDHAAYFLSNASSWRGDEARQVKAELRRRGRSRR